MRIDRRRALALLGLGAAGPAAGQATTGTVAFRHGVASGDPLQDRVVIWTRITPETPGGEIEYRWRLNPVDRRAGGARSGVGVTGPGRDYTCKVDVAGLSPGRAYAFEFEAAGVTSPTGRTRTLPAGGVKDVVLAVASCSLYPNGYFHAYQAIADLPRVDAVLHLGDYIYEYGGPDSYGDNSPVAPQRRHAPYREIVSLGDYRTRHAQYKSDPSLQAAHARAPWIVAWDDHETANDSFLNGAENHTAGAEGDWATRKAAALKAYYEWMPIREPAPGQGLAEAAARSFRFGDLAQLIMVETRLSARDQQLDLERDLPKVDGKPDVAAFKARLNDPDRRMMGPAQEAWIGRELAASVKAGHAWQVIGNQVVMARVDGSLRAALTPDEAARVEPRALRRIERRDEAAALGVPAALDMWDGYPADRERLYGLFREAGARPIVVSGDSHSFWANDLKDAYGRRVAAEFGTTGITSPGAGEVVKGLDFGEIIARANPEVLYNNQVAKGFVLLTLTRAAARAEMVAVSTIVEPTFTAAPVKRFVVRPQGSGVARPAEA
ncbi:alkaline phosphatase D family protein [Phenylobacterium sp.]|uniref:alkaline phosphatase D family protein n=1 Tax=Phenylobacterium sp. TaxID=1871053 RepID=UPI002FDFA5F8